MPKMLNKCKTFYSLLFLAAQGDWGTEEKV